MEQGISRRGFLTRTGLAGAGLLAEARLAAGDGAGGRGQGVAIVHDSDDAVAAAPAAQWALGQLRDALAARGVPARVCRRLDEVTPGEACVLAGGGTAPRPREALDRSGTALPDHPEALALLAGRANQRPVLLACGRDASGLMYALLELADRVAHAGRPLDALDVRRPVVERPANPIRSVARLFTSDVEDRAWFHDRAFWPPYLGMLAAQRFNRFSLTLGLGYDFPRDIRDAYLHFAYPFLVAVPGYQVRAAPLPDAERARNLDTLRFISDEAARRGYTSSSGSGPTPTGGPTARTRITPSRASPPTVTRPTAATRSGPSSRPARPSPASPAAARRGFSRRPPGRPGRWLRRVRQPRRRVRGDQADVRPASW
jgi:hypothetical protein